MEAILLTTDRGSQCIDLPADPLLAISAIKRWLGGTVELIAVDSKRFIACLENGKLAPHDYNTAATTIAHQACAIPTYDYIAGDALLFDKQLVEVAA